jgi:hypothetical protein
MSGRHVVPGPTRDGLGAPARTPQAAADEVLVDDRHHVDRPPAQPTPELAPDDDRSREQRLYRAAAAHYDLAADSHDGAAIRHARRGERDDAAREHTLATDARGKADRARERARQAATRGIPEPA